MSWRLTNVSSPYQDDDQLFELVPLPDVSDDVTARRIRLSVKDKDIRALLLKGRKQGAEKRKKPRRSTVEAGNIPWLRQGILKGEVSL